jgi:hypothetical protein
MAGQPRAEPVAPVANRFVTHCDAALEQEFLDVAQAKVESMVTSTLRN